MWIFTDAWYYYSYHESLSKASLFKPVATYSSLYGFNHYIFLLTSLIIKPNLNNFLCEFKESMTVSDQFPCGLRVLVVDDDASCLIILEKMLLRLMYQGNGPNGPSLSSKSSLKFLPFCSYHLLPSRRRFNPLERKKRLFRSGLERCSYAWYERLQTPPASRSRDGSSCHQ